MRRSLLAILLVVLVVPALSGPASARQRSVHHRYRLARQHVLPVRADNFAPGLYAYAPDSYARDTYARDPYAPVFATRQANVRRNNLRKNNWRQNDWGQSGFGQSNWSQKCFNQPLDGMAAAQASANGVPVSLVERVIKRMAANVVLEGAVGAVPFAGDAFDIFFRANRRNVALLRRHFARVGFI